MLGEKYTKGGETDTENSFQKISPLPPSSHKEESRTKNAPFPPFFSKIPVTH